MRQTLLSTTLALTLAATPLLAEEDDPVAQGLGLLGEGSRLVLEGLMGELAPLLEDLDPALRELEGRGAELLPFLRDLQDELGETLSGLSAYHPPEMLPNGDIILRRKTEPEQEVEPNPDGTVDL